MLSVVIPAYNEARALPATLDHLAGQTGDHEIIVVDGGSNDATRDIVRARPEFRLLSAPKGRASQMNAGARAARGDWLLFLHADTLLPDDTLARLETECEKRGCAAGGFRQRFTGDDWRLRAISWLHNTRCRVTKIFYGDQAMFVRRDLFLSLGGFPEVPMLEDVLFSEKLKRATRPVLLDESVLTDSRKFVQRGVVKSFGRVLLILACHRLGFGVGSRAFFEDVR